MSNFSSISEVINLWKNEPESFSDQALFRRACTNQSLQKQMRGHKQEPLALTINSMGRFILVQIGEEHYALPHPKVRMDAVSRVDCGFEEFFECPGWNERSGEYEFELLALAQLKDEGQEKLTLIQKGIMQFK